jgi:hypothetical protein
MNISTIAVRIVQLVQYTLVRVNKTTCAANIEVNRVINPSATYPWLIYDLDIISADVK